MPVELKDVATYLGIDLEKVKDVDDFKSTFDKEFIKSSSINEDSEPVKKILGKTFGTLENEIKKVARGYDVEVDFDSEEFKGKKVTEKLKAVFGEYDKKKQSLIEELTAKAGQGNDEKVKEWEKKYGKLEGKFKDTEGLLTKTATDFEDYKKNSEGTVKGIKLSIHKKDLYSKAKFAPDENQTRFELTKKGFFADFETKYKIDLDENESPILLNGKGEKIASTKTAGAFKTVEEALEEELNNAKLSALNPDAGKKKPATQIQQPATPFNAERKIAQRM